MTREQKIERLEDLARNHCRAEIRKMAREEIFAIFTDDLDWFSVEALKGDEDA
jgi:hypothetical protein